VVLGGGYRDVAPEYGGHDLGPYTLERVRYAAWLHHKTGLPVLVSGGDVFNRGVAESRIMARYLRDEHAVPTVLIEDTSRNTYENAQKSAALLAQRAINRALLVTHAWHMARAVDVFNTTSLTVIPAPTAFEGLGSPAPALFGYLPNAKGIERSSLALHEILGRVWYRLRNT